MGFAAERVAALMAAVFVVITMGPELAAATVYKVGDAAGWTIIGGVDYKQWAATKTFQVGDAVVFEYNPQFHNVMRVTHAMYKSCNVSAPLETHTSGNDTIAITTRGHHFFVCGFPGHCQAGQKVDINVQRHTSAAVVPSPSVPLVIPTPAPAPSGAASRLGGGLALLALLFSVVA
ncbi:mavicyanin-like [Cucurbita maxima]|uniref:Mavicyanin-like n=1 Tax=Cucurbita maxima TaxID=3661 RepID=A0A6J1KBY7_CUCMA|nr:mavicyanin-like [Cucurbita maxima]